MEIDRILRLTWFESIDQSTKHIFIDFLAFDLSKRKIAKVRFVHLLPPTHECQHKMMKHWKLSIGLSSASFSDDFMITFTIQQLLR